MRAPHNADKIVELNEQEKKTLLYMAMKSLRGSWRQWQQRNRVVYLLATDLPPYPYSFDPYGSPAEEREGIISTDKIQSRSVRFRDGDYGGHRDGRTSFRRIYQSIDTEASDLTADRETLAYLASLLDHDLTWDDHKLGKVGERGYL